MQKFASKPFVLCLFFCLVLFIHGIEKKNLLEILLFAYFMRDANE